jgi:predicted anti-sigma-YlaC factor YlaD
MEGMTIKVLRPSLFASLLFAVLAASAFSGCTVNTLVANALTGGDAAVVFTGDPDPQLVGDAIPFALKMYEALLHSTPNHVGLMLTTGSMFVMYANAFVQGPAEMLPATEVRARNEANDRAMQLYMRGYSILTDALEQRYRGFSSAIENEQDFKLFVQRFRKQDVPLLYWTVAGGLSAYSLDPMGELSFYMPMWQFMIEKAYELDPDYGGATLDEFFVLYYASIPEMMGGDMERARHHFDIAMEKTGGRSSSALISYANAISRAENDRATFEQRLRSVLALNPDDNPSARLVTVLDQRKARWLLDNADSIFR